MATKPAWPSVNGQLEPWASDLTRLLDEWSSRIQAEQSTAPFLPAFSASALPDPAKYGSTELREGHSRLIFVPDAAGGPSLLYSDGTSWITIATPSGPVQSVTGGSGITVDNSDPQNPEIATLASVDGQVTSRDLALSDAQGFIFNPGSSDITLTIPPESSVAFPIGTEIDISQAGVGTITVSPGSGVTLVGKTATRGSGHIGDSIFLIKRGSDQWVARFTGIGTTWD